MPWSASTTPPPRVRRERRFISWPGGGEGSGTRFSPHGCRRDHGGGAVLGLSGPPHLPAEELGSFQTQNTRRSPFFPWPRAHQPRPHSAPFPRLRGGPPETSTRP